jgi:hypothetical protein
MPVNAPVAASVFNPPGAVAIAAEGHVGLRASKVSVVEYEFVGL